MASDLEEEMQIESESSLETRELLPREGPITYNRYGSFVALVDDKSLETQPGKISVDEADERVKTEVAREHFTF